MLEVWAMGVMITIIGATVIIIFMLGIGGKR